jgi:thioredoxin-related protein
MFRNKVNIIFTLVSVLILIGCGNSGEIAEGPDPVVEGPSSSGEDGKGKATIETFGSAEPEPEVRKEVMDVEGDAEAIEWLDFESAIDKNQVEKRFIFIDLYTDWCTWCKKMDRSTFQHPSVINYIDQNFYAVKLNPEKAKAIAYKEVLYEMKPYGSKMYNELAVNLAGGRLVFPSFIILNKREVKRGVVEGFQTPSQLLSQLRRYVE